MINGRRLACSAMTAGAEVTHMVMTGTVLSNYNGGKKRVKTIANVVVTIL